MRILKSFIISLFTVTILFHDISSFSLVKPLFAQGLKHRYVEDYSRNKSDQGILPIDLSEIDLDITFKENIETQHSQTVTFTKAIDGQTLLTDDGDIVYLEGLFIPSTDQNDLVAKTFLEKNFIDVPMKLFTCKSKNCKTKDRYGHIRTHAVKEDGNIWVQASLLAAGYAQVRTRADWPALNKEMQNVENRKAPLWENDNHNILNAVSISPEIRGYRVVEGQIESIAMYKNKVYLNFGKNWKTDFTVVVPSQQRRAFSKSGINIMSWNKAKIMVRGWIDEYNGPFIEIDHVEQIENLSETVNQVPQSE